MSAIHYAAFTGDLSLIKLMISNGGDIFQKNDTGMTALQFAAQGNQAAVITYLLDEHKFDINQVDSKQSSALHWAIFNSNEIALSFLLARNPNVNLQDMKGVTPLHLAVESSRHIGTTSLIRMLLMK